MTGVLWFCNSGNGQAGVLNQIIVAGKNKIICKDTAQYYEKNFEYGQSYDSDMIFILKF